MYCRWDTSLRPLYVNKMRQVGAAMLLEHHSQHNSAEFFISFSQTLLSDQDLSREVWHKQMQMSYLKLLYLADLTQERTVCDRISRKCVHYPTPQHRSYSNCDERFVLARLPPAFTPLYATRQLETVTTMIRWSGRLLTFLISCGKQLSM